MKKLLSLLLVLALVLSIAACGAKPEVSTGGEATGGDTSGGDTTGGDSSGGFSQPAVGGLPTNYSEAYEFYIGFTDIIGEAVNRPIEMNNARLEETEPDTYFSNPAYTYVIFSPYLSMSLAFTATFTDTTTAAEIVPAFTYLGIEDTTYTKVAPNSYKVTYTTVDYDTEQPCSVEVIAQFNPANAGLRYVEYITLDGVTTVDEMYEFISLGNDRYAMQSNTGRSLFTCKDGIVSELYHSYTRYDYFEEEFEMVKITNDPDADSIFNATGLDEAWVKEKGPDMLESIYSLADGTLTLELTDTSYIWTDDERTGKEWTWKDPVVIPVS